MGKPAKLVIKGSATALTFFTALANHPVLAQLLQPTGGGGSGTVSGNNPRFGGEIVTIILRIIDFLIGIVGVVMVILIILGGIRMIMSAGDPKAMQSARNAVTFAVIGLIVVLLAVSTVIIVGNFFGIQNLNVVNFSFT